MSCYKEYKKRALQNPEVKAEYDAQQPEYDIIQAMIDARVKQDIPTPTKKSKKNNIFRRKGKLYVRKIKTACCEVA